MSAFPPLTLCVTPGQGFPSQRLEQSPYPGFMPPTRDAHMRGDLPRADIPLLPSGARRRLLRVQDECRSGG